MTPADGKRLVLVGTVGTGVIAGVASLKKGTAPSAKIAVGVMVIGVTLAALAEVAPKPAGAIAMTALVSSAFVLGGDAWSGLAGITGSQLKPAPAGKFDPRLSGLNS